MSDQINQIPKVSEGATPPTQQSLALDGSFGFGKITAGLAGMAMIDIMKAFQLVLSMVETIMQQRAELAKIQGQTANAEAQAIRHRGMSAAIAGGFAGAIGIGTAIGGFALSSGKIGGNAIKTQQLELNDIKARGKTLNSLTKDLPVQHGAREGELPPLPNNYERIKNDLKSGKFAFKDEELTQAREVLIASKDHHPEEYAAIKERLEQKIAQNTQQHYTATTHLNTLHGGNQQAGSALSAGGQAASQTAQSISQSVQAQDESDATLNRSSGQMASTQVTNLDQMSNKEYENATNLLRTIRELENNSAAATGSLAGG